MLNIQYYMHYLPGEGTAGSQQPVALARMLAGRGHDVTVLSSDLNLDTGGREEPLDMAVGGGRLRILRLPSPQDGRGSNLQRMKAYLTFMRRVKRRAMALERPDAIVGSIQPLFTGWAAMRVAAKKRSPFLLEVRDLWPDALVVKGALGPTTAKPLYWMADRLYRNASRIVTLTPGIKVELLKKGIPSSKVDVFPNGFDPRLFEGSGALRDEIRQRYGWGDDFVAIFTGSYTRVTAVEVIVEAARVLSGRKGLRFELFGAGPTRAEVEALARSHGLGNVHFHDPVPKREVPGLLAGADAALMCLFRTPLAHIYFENKFMDYMGAGKGILASFEGQQAEILRRSGAGWVVPPMDGAGLASLVERAMTDRDAFHALGEAGRKLVHGQLLLPDVLARYCDRIEDVAAGRASAMGAWEPSL
jgi:glycosyltransferase involved in cell wall biosynthesis